MKTELTHGWRRPLDCAQVFCQPPLATVGFSEEEATARFSGELDVYVSRFKAMKNTLAGREEKTLMKLIVHKASNQVVGAHMVGPDAAEIMQARHCSLQVKTGLHVVSTAWCIAPPCLSRVWPASTLRVRRLGGCRAAVAMSTAAHGTHAGHRRRPQGRCDQDPL